MKEKKLTEHLQKKEEKREMYQKGFMAVIS